VQTATKYHRVRIEATLAKAGVATFKGETVTAYLNHGRWVADCPCNGAELVTPGETMLCGSCGAEHKVGFPTKKQRGEIETLLAKRNPPNQNWHGETVDELLAENIEHGLWEDL